MLAYADDDKMVLGEDSKGKREYLKFNRYDFLEQDAAGNWVWNDEFLFSADTSAPLASNRSAMWQETLMNFQMGAFGNPAELDTLILYWTKMEKLHYPSAAQTVESLRNKQETMMKQQQEQKQAQHQAMQGQMEQLAKQKAEKDAGEILQDQQSQQEQPEPTEEELAQIEEQAVQAAAADALAGLGL